MIRHENIHTSLIMYADLVLFRKKNPSVCVDTYIQQQLMKKRTQI